MEGRVWQALADSSRGPEISPGGRGVCVLCRRERTYRPYLQKDSSFSVIELVTPCEICSDLYHTGWLWLSPLSETLKTGFHSLIFLPSTRQQHHMIERREIENNLELRQKHCKSIFTLWCLSVCCSTTLRPQDHWSGLAQLAERWQRTGTGASRPLLWRSVHTTHRRMTTAALSQLSGWVIAAPNTSPKGEEEEEEKDRGASKGGRDFTGMSVNTEIVLRAKRPPVTCSGCVLFKTESSILVWRICGLPSFTHPKTCAAHHHPLPPLTRHWITRDWVNSDVIVIA